MDTVVLWHGKQLLGSLASATLLRRPSLAHDHDAMGLGADHRLSVDYNRLS